MSRPAFFLDDAAHGQISVFNTPLATIRADTPEDVPNALQKIQHARDQGKYAAGFLSYELGYVSEPRLLPLLPRNRDVPLIWFGVFEKPEVLNTAGKPDIFTSWLTGRAHAGPLTFDWDAETYRRHFDAVQALIRAGDIYEANLTFGARFPFFGDPLSLYRKLRKTSACGFGAFIDTGSHQILSLSPELFFETEDGHITCRPMKGTAPRHNNPLTDEYAARALQTSVKERAENLMIVDLLRNDVSRISEIGSVQVPKLFEIESYPTVHQMTSTVTAKLKPHTTVTDILHALFPCGSITGAPKIRSMEILREIEDTPRNIYCGAIGFFAPHGHARFSVSIRTLTISGQQGRLGIGGAVVYDSKSDAEYAEARLKARYMDLACRRLELIETLRFDPAQGFIRLPRHLDRMQMAAAHFSIPFSRATAQAELDTAVRGATQILRVRLSLTEGAGFTCTTAPLAPTPAVWRYYVTQYRISSADAFARYKTGKRNLYTASWQRAHDLYGADEVIFRNERGEIAEGSRSNIFVRRGSGPLLTPPLTSGALDGVLRAELISTGQAEEAVLTVDDLENKVFFGNSLRGLIAGAATEGHNGEVE